jgi:hypothetical protein
MIERSTFIFSKIISYFTGSSTRDMSPTVTTLGKIERIAHGFRPFELANILPFRDAMRLADRLLTHNYMYDPWRHYAIEFLYAIRDRFLDEWSLSWRYDAYLGNACVFACRYDERYKACRQAMTKVSPAPPELLVALASCNSAPGKPPVSEEEALRILSEVAHKKPYKDVVRMLVRGCYERFREKPEELVYWEKLYQKLEESGEDEKLPGMTPEFLREDIKTDLSKLSPSPKKNMHKELFEIAKRVFSSEEIPSSVRGIAVGLEGDEIVLWVYHAGKLDADTQSMSLMAYTRIAAYYLKDYSLENNRNIQIDPPEELPHHEEWVFLN